MKNTMSFDDALFVRETPADHYPVAHYTSEPFTGHDGDETTCTVDVLLCGDGETGYAFRTRDDADGPHDGLGKAVYPTREAAMAALPNLLDQTEDGWIEALYRES